MMTPKTIWRAGWLGLVALVGCDREQLLLSVDTDALVTAQLRGHPELPIDPVLDTLRIEILGPDGTVLDLCEHFALDRDNWPVTFGVAPAPPGHLLRVRLFRRALAGTTTVPGLTRLCGEPLRGGTVPQLSDPLPEITIDRLVALPDTAGGLRRLALQLPLNCMGVESSLLTRRSCMDGDQAPSVAVNDPAQWQAQPAASSRAGMSRLLDFRGCSTAPPQGVSPDDVACVPAGFFLMGDDKLVESVAYLVPRPLRAVTLRPFYMDRVEFFVGRMKRVLATAKQRGIQLDAPYPGSAYATGEDEFYNCTWNLPKYGDDRLPVNCISAAAARAACQFVGGDLPTEAQWEYAARGRGRRWPYAWGTLEPNESPTCCKTATRRWSLADRPPNYQPDPTDRCKEYGPAPVGDYTDAGCPEGGDVSIDGILDLAGNVAEYTRDDLVAYSKRCGVTGGVTQNPFCELYGSRNKAQRGGGWLRRDDPSAFSAARKQPELGLQAQSNDYLPALASGFRCVYAGSPGEKP